VEELSPAAFVARRARGEDLTLLDVREPWELAVARIDGALHIPMAEIPGRLAELDPAKPVVVLCHSGMRSARVGHFLESRGFATVANLTGGIDAWSQVIDPTVPRY
jgi:rhodanese-related sulfurtransferase